MPVRKPSSQRPSEVDGLKNPTRTSRGTAADQQPAAARRAVRSPAAASPGAITHLQRTAGNRAVQRLLAQRAEVIGAQGGEAPAAVQAGIEQARGGGQPLDSKINQQVGGALGVNFGGVRVHTGPASDQLNQAVSAKAFTTGSDIFFSQGAYKPDTTSGKRLLAHELTHVVQQTGPGAAPVARESDE